MFTLFLLFLQLPGFQGNSKIKWRRGRYIEKGRRKERDKERKIEYGYAWSMWYERGDYSASAFTRQNQCTRSLDNLRWFILPKLTVMNAGLWWGGGGGPDLEIGIVCMSVMARACCPKCLHQELGAKPAWHTASTWLSWNPPPQLLFRPTTPPPSFHHGCCRLSAPCCYCCWFPFALLWLLTCFSVFHPISAFWMLY